MHLIQLGNNRQVCFYADWLAEHAGKAPCLVHAYVLMTNHVHLLVSGGKERLWEK